MPSLPLAVISLFLIKPLYKLTSNKRQEPNSNRKTGEGNIQKLENSKQVDNQTCTTEFNETSDSDSQTQVLRDNICT